MEVVIDDRGEEEVMGSTEEDRVEWGLHSDEEEAAEEGDGAEPEYLEPYWIAVLDRPEERPADGSFDRFPVIERYCQLR